MTQGSLSESKYARSRACPYSANLAVLLENIDPVRSYELATMAVGKLGSIQQLSTIIESHESIVDSDAVKLTDIEQNEELPMLESRETNDDFSKSEEMPIIESRKIEDEEVILLEARPVETIDEVINNAKEMLIQIGQMRHFHLLDLD